MKTALALTLLLPDRLPSLIVLIGFWIPPAAIGWVAAEYFQRNVRRYRATVIFAVLAIFVLSYAVAWYFFNLHRMPPYIPGALPDPTIATAETAKGLALFTSGLVLPGSVLACALAYWLRNRVAANR